jgi:imidazolonepropionase-like amidohydrolase
VTGGGYFGLASLVELELLVKAGLTASQAIVAATRTSAAILGLDALGTIAPGKSAAFIVLNANPLDDIANARKISAVYLDGAAVDRDALRTKWSAARSSGPPLRPPSRRDRIRSIAR